MSEQQQGGVMCTRPSTRIVPQQRSHLLQEGCQLVAAAQRAAWLGCWQGLGGKGLLGFGIDRQRYAR